LQKIGQTAYNKR